MASELSEMSALPLAVCLVKAEGSLILEQVSGGFSGVEEIIFPFDKLMLPILAPGFEDFSPEGASGSRNFNKLGGSTSPFPILEEHGPNLTKSSLAAFKAW